MKGKGVTVHPSQLRGELHIQPSKSYAHRAFICAAYAEGRSVISNIHYSQDIKATIRSLSAMGIARFTPIGESSVQVDGRINGEMEDKIDCGESGSTLRFLLPLALLNGKKHIFTGSPKLLSRPLSVYEEIFKKRGLTWAHKGSFIELQGVLESGRYEIRGDISSQFITGLLFTLPLLDGKSEIVITGSFESKEYVDITLEVMKDFGVNLFIEDNNTIQISGGSKYTPCEYNVEADYSHSAFFLTAGALSGKVTCTGLTDKSSQPDRVIVDALKLAGADINKNNGSYSAERKMLKPFVWDLSQCPDLAPVLSVFACGCVGESRLINGSRLRFKESDRLHAMACELSKLGADVTEGDDYLVINGKGYLNGGYCLSHNDHRVAMALAVASCISKEDIHIDDYSVVNKSAPAFWDEFKKLGGTFTMDK